MSTIERRLANAKSQGQAQFNSIREMVETLRQADDIDQDAVDAAREAIEENPLSVLVRSGWHEPGICCGKTDRYGDGKPEEYEILLCTGGPACRIIGDLGEHGEPTTATMEVQDWFTPWTLMRPLVGPDNYDSEPIMLAYARVFWFGD